MGYPIDRKFVVAVASSALFDLADADAVFREKGEDAYREYQRQNEAVILRPGVAYPLVRRLLALNKEFGATEPIEVVLLSKNDPETGLRVFNSVESHGLSITRAAFVSGRDPFRYMGSFNAALFLSANKSDVEAAVGRGLPAGQVHPSQFLDDEDGELRIAFDFDGVLADDSAEKVYAAGALDLFHQSEKEHAEEALPPGPLKQFLAEVSRLQALENERQKSDPTYRPRIRTAIVTARNAPAHKRVITTLRSWGIKVDEGFFLGGIDKSRVLAEFRPHIFFDDQLTHIRDAANVVPAVHVPFGIRNTPSPPD